MTIDAGDLAPDFSTQTDAGTPFSLGDLRGKTVVLYFYPRADTPGCTVEACGIRDEFAGFQRVGAEVLGISPDTVEAQAAFKAKYQLPFTLLADPDHAIADLFGVLGPAPGAGPGVHGRSPHHVPDRPGREGAARLPPGGSG